MPCVHYQFSSQLCYDTVTFSGLHISLGDLKCQIMGRQKLKAATCDLRIANAQTKEEYTDDNALIPKNSSVIVRRVPVRGVKATSKTRVITRTKPASGTSKAIEDSSAPTPLAQLIKETQQKQPLLCSNHPCKMIPRAVLLLPMAIFWSSGIKFSSKTPGSFTWTSEIAAEEE
ncbi:E3 ubiquitin-protein ligase RBBP6-like [Strix uralensis]|uniref:E3 ubiquitin-protein ligase RBBP6-like n=1 Tax=Strix uralensis TaxID=36305 RepID=UPI003DA6D9A9